MKVIFNNWSLKLTTVNVSLAINEVSLRVSAQHNNNLLKKDNWPTTASLRYSENARQRPFSVLD